MNISAITILALPTLPENCCGKCPRVGRWPGVPWKEKVTEIPKMHKSQLAGFIIDCQTDDIDHAAAFWSAALGLEAEVDPDPDEDYLIVKNPAMGLTYVYKNGVGEYFDSDRWTVFLFE